MLLSENFEVIGTYYSTKPENNFSKNITFHHLDISDKKSIDEFYDMIKDKKIDFFTNTIANSLNLKTFDKLEPEDYEEDIKNNLLNQVYLLKKVIHQFNVQSDIVFILTKAIIGNPPRAFSSYVVSKFALLGLMKSLAVELKNIKVNAVSPGMMDTKFVPEFLKRFSTDLTKPEEVANEIKKIIHSKETGRNISV